MVTGRRFGKTTMDAHYLVDTALRRPGTLSTYITLTRKNSKLLLWPELAKMNHKYKLGMKPNVSELTYRLPNGSWIWLSGADSEDAIEKFRGFKPALNILDECASFGPHIDALIEEVLEPGLLDFDGTNVLTGTPGPICAGAFYEATTNPAKGYMVKRGTCLDNPFLPQAKAWLERKRIERGWNTDDPRYLREWMGIWIRDLNSLVYRYDALKSDYDVLPVGHTWEYVLGVDFGYRDSTGFSVIAFSRTHPNVFHVEAWKKSEMLVSDVAERLRWYMGRYSFTRIIGDAGALGKMLVEEFRKRQSVPIIAAEKQHKFAFIELLNSDLATGRFRVKKESPVVTEWGQLQWDDARKKEQAAYANDLSDATLYAWREAKHFCYVATDPPPTTPEEVLEREAEKLERRAEKRVRGRKQRPFWE